MNKIDITRSLFLLFFREQSPQGLWSTPLKMISSSSIYFFIKNLPEIRTQRTSVFLPLLFFFFFSSLSFLYYFLLRLKSGYHCTKISQAWFSSSVGAPEPLFVMKSLSQSMLLGVLCSSLFSIYRCYLLSHVHIIPSSSPSFSFVPSSPLSSSLFLVSLGISIALASYCSFQPSAKATVTISHSPG